MRIALDISPLKGDKFLQHRVRGTGFYTRYLKQSLEEYFPENTYTFFSQGEKLSSKIEIVHYPYFEPFFLTLPLKKLFPTVVTVHDLTPLVFPKYFPAGIRGKIKWFIQKLALQKVDAFIADSEQSKKDIMKFAGIDQKYIHVVYLAAASHFMPLRENLLERNLLMKLKKKHNLPEKFALYVGDITWNKNLPRLVQAIKLTTIPLVMVGKALVEKNFDESNSWNQDRKEVQQLAGSDDRIIRLGFVSDEDLVGLYNLASVFVMPSLYEGFGLPILEAMSCGCPVITSKEGSIREVAGDSAYFVNAYDITNIAKGIIEVFNSQYLQKRLSEKALEQAKKFSWEKTSTRTVNVYSMVLNC